MFTFSSAVFVEIVEKWQYSLFFSLLPGNWSAGDWFGETASTTTKSAQIDVIS
jgi:hypothetical protein